MVRERKLEKSVIVPGLLVVYTKNHLATHEMFTMISSHVVDEEKIDTTHEMLKVLKTPAVLMRRK